MKINSEHGVSIINYVASDFYGVGLHICVNLHNKDEKGLECLNDVLSHCLKEIPEKCFIHFGQDPCSSVVGKMLLFYQEFCQKFGKVMIMIYHYTEGDCILKKLKLHELDEELLKVMSIKEFENVAS